MKNLISIHSYIKQYYVKEKMEIGQISKPRFEFRSFGQSFETAHQRMARLSMPVPEKVWERHSDEIYILSRTNDINNTKIRDGKMDIKNICTNRSGPGAMESADEREFPIKTEVLQKEVFPAFQVSIPVMTADIITYEAFLEMVDQHPDLQAVRVHKQRYGYLVNDAICEYGVVLINGARVVTINAESTEMEDILKTIREIGLEGVENINYLQAIKRVIGMINKPLANE
jgi:hypothetical protein